MAYWNFRIAVVLSKSIVQFEGARHQQIDIIAKKRKVSGTKTMVLLKAHLSDVHTLHVNKTCFLFFIAYDPSSASGRWDVDHFGYFLHVLAAIPDIFDVQDVYTGIEHRDQTSVYGCLLASSC